jgi:hypothetical protein
MDSLRSRVDLHLAQEQVRTPDGHISGSIVDALVSMKANKNLNGLQAVYDEANAICSYAKTLLVANRAIDQFLNTGSPNARRTPKMELVRRHGKPDPVQTEQIKLADIKVAEAKPHAFNEEAFPGWFLEYLETGEIEHLRHLTPDEAKSRVTIVAGKVISKTTAGKISWEFYSNRTKRGYGYVPKDVAPNVPIGSSWLFQHNGKNGLDSVLLGGIPYDEEELGSHAQVLADIYHMYNLKVQA